MHMSNVVLAPHIGTSTREIREGRMSKLLADLRAHFCGEAVALSDVRARHIQDVADKGKKTPDAM
jgi:phosphoglycerate dehydrogenase-like enzyme